MKLLLILLFSIVAQYCRAQEAITITYYRYPSTDFNKKRFVEDDQFGLRAVMVFNDSVCFAQFAAAADLDELSARVIAGDKVINHAMWYAKTTNECYDETNLKSGKYLVISDSTSMPEWKATANHKVILGYNCSSVEATYKKRKIVVWYTDELKFKNAPLFYPGVPGVVLEVYDQRRGVHFKPISIVHTITSIEKPKDIAIVTDKQYREIQKKILNQTAF